MGNAGGLERRTGPRADWTYLPPQEVHLGLKSGKSHGFIARNLSGNGIRLDLVRTSRTWSCWVGTPWLAQGASQRLPKHDLDLVHVEVAAKHERDHKRARLGQVPSVCFLPEAPVVTISFTVHNFPKCSGVETCALAIRPEARVGDPSARNEIVGVLVSTKDADLTLRSGGRQCE